MHLDILPAHPHNIAALMALDGLHHPPPGTAETARHAGHDGRPQRPRFLPPGRVRGEVDRGPRDRGAVAQALWAGSEVGDHGAADGEGFGRGGVDWGREVAGFLPSGGGQECVVVVERVSYWGLGSAPLTASDLGSG